MKQRFIVSASYTGECCSNSHILVSFIEAPNKKAARERVKRRLHKGDWDVGDMVVIAVSDLSALFKDSKS